MAGVPKVNAAPAVLVPLAFASKGYTAAGQLIGKYPITAQFEALKAHPAAQKAIEKKELLLALLGLALVFHGSQFKNLLLCTQVVIAFLYERVKTNVVSMYSDIQSAREKMQADGPADAKEKEGEDDKNKHAKKREAKKAGDKGNSEQQMKDHAEAAKKVLKVLDSERLSSAALEVLGAAVACLLVIHGGLAQKVAIGHAFVSLVADRIEGVLDFPGFEDMEEWTRVMMRFALYAVVMPVAFVAGPLALAMNAAVCGAELAIKHGVAFLASIGKIEDSEAVLKSKQGFVATCGLAAFGTLWQLWSWAAAGGMAWYFQLIYLPALIAEGFLGML